MDDDEADLQRRGMDDDKADLQRRGMHDDEANYQLEWALLGKQEADRQRWEYSSNGDGDFPSNGESFMGEEEDAGDGSDIRRAGEFQTADDVGSISNVRAYESPTMDAASSRSDIRASESPTREDAQSNELRVWEESWCGWSSWSPIGEYGRSLWEGSRPHESPMRADGWGIWPVEIHANPRVGSVPLDKLGCGICYLPLQPPIYQCEVGHVVCSPCCDKLKATGKCHICGVANGGYRRCHAMECVVDSVHVNCPNAAHGCSVRTTYYDQRNHIERCVHAPWRCPKEACGFSGSQAALWHHLSSVHSWPCSKGRAGKQFEMTLQDGLEFNRELTNVVTLRDGFNFFLADLAADSNDHGATITASANSQYLFLLNVAREPLGRIISVLRIDPHAVAAAGNGQGPSSKEVKCELAYTRHSRPRDYNQVIEHFQKSRFRVACSNLSNGLSMTSLDGCFKFVIPDSIAADFDGDAIVATVRIMVE